MIFRKHNLLAFGAVVIMVMAGTGGVMASDHGSRGDNDQPITGQALDDCTAAALALNAGGTVTETEIGDDGAAYGVEIRL